MKKLRPLQSGAAFTLIELLVVICIIAVLATIAMNVQGGVMKQMKKVQAKTDMTNLANAIQAYYAEYGRYPAGGTAVTGTADVTYGASPTAGNEMIVNILRYPITPPATTAPSGWTDTDNMNPRQIKFLQVPDAKNQGDTAGNPPKSGILRSRGSWFDPWGYQYVIFIDGDYGGDIAWGSVYNSIGADTTGKAQISVGVASVGLHHSTQSPPIQQNPTAPAVQPHNFDNQNDLISWR